MSDETTTEQAAADHLTTDQAADTEELTSEMLVEEVSIDGMCGVY